MLNLIQEFREPGVHLTIGWRATGSQILPKPSKLKGSKGRHLCAQWSICLRDFGVWWCSFMKRATLTKPVLSVCLELQFLRWEAIIIYFFQMICQLEGGTQIFCIKDCGTQDLKTIHLIPQYEDQRNYLQSGKIKVKVISSMSDSRA